MVYLISVAIEARSAIILPLLISCLQAVGVPRPSELDSPSEVPRKRNRPYKSFTLQTPFGMLSNSIL